MTFIALTGLNDVRAPEIHSEGRVPLCIVDAKITEKEGKTNIRTIIEIEEPHSVPGASWANMFHYVALPNRNDDADKVQTKLRMAKQFFVQFGIPYDNGINVEEMVGCRADGNITVEEYEGQLSNKLKTNPLPRE